MPENIIELINDLTGWGLRVEDIAARTGAGVMTVYRWRSGKMKPQRMSMRRVQELWRYEKRKHEEVAG
jgi:hypothetical protein